MSASKFAGIGTFFPSDILTPYSLTSVEGSISITIFYFSGGLYIDISFYFYSAD